MKLTALIAAALLAGNAAAAPVTPRIVTKSGVRTFHVFRTQLGAVTRVACSLAEFNALFVKGSKPPTLANHTYLRSIRAANFGTPEVTFTEGDALAVTGGVVVGLNGRKYLLSGATVNAGRISAGTYGDVVVDAQGRVEATAVAAPEAIERVGR